MTTEFIQYLQQQIHTTDDRITRYTHHINGHAYPKRLIFDRISDYINAFITKQSNQRMIIIPGFRGVGKTTVMAQLCAYYKQHTPNINHPLFLSIEDSIHFVGAGISPLMQTYAQIIGQELSSINTPTLIFLDEIQTDPKWTESLKILFETTNNIFFCCSGSAAVILQSTSNIARRAIFEKLTPMSFSEYALTKHHINIPQNTQKAIQKAIYFSSSAEEAYQTLQTYQPEINQYWSSFSRTNIHQYLAHGSLPFTFDMPNETAIYDSISMLIDRMITQDLPMLGNFDHKTLNLIKKILFSIAEHDSISIYKLSDTLDISRPVITDILDALVKAEILIKVPAYGANMKIAKKPSKYLFMSPAIRMSFFYFTGIENTYMVRQGRLFEDAVATHLYNEFIIKGQGSLRYDSHAGGADFILQILNHKQIIMELGIGKKNAKQIITSQKRIHSDYNLIIADQSLTFDQHTNTIHIPLEYYFLM